LVSDIPAGDGKMANSFLQCRIWHLLYVVVDSDPDFAFLVATKSWSNPDPDLQHCSHSRRLVGNKKAASSFVSRSVSEFLVLLHFSIL
jgi:hypothetical protein